MHRSRREFIRFCTSLGVALPFASSLIRPSGAQTAGSVVASNNGERTVKFRYGTIVPALGQGSWRLAQGRHPEAVVYGARRMMAAESLLGFGKNGQPPANVRFEAHCELRSEIAPHPRMGQKTWLQQKASRINSASIAEAIQASGD